MAESFKCKSVTAFSKKNTDFPIIGHFSNGPLVLNSEKMVTGVYRDAKKSSRIVVVETSDMQYEGTIESGSSSPSGVPRKRQKLLCGLFNKITGSLVLTETVEVNLNPVTSGLAHDVQAHSDDATFRDKTDNLALAFGTKKAQKSITSRKSGQVSSDVLDDDIGGASLYVSANAEKSEGVNLSISGTESEGWLTINWDAATPLEAYDVTEITPDRVVVSLSNYLPTHQFGNLTRDTIQHLFKESSYPKCVLNRLSGLLRGYDIMGLEGGWRTQAVRLLYLLLLIKLYNMKYKDLNRKYLSFEEEPKIPDTVREHLETSYTVVSLTKEGRSKRGMPERLKDKCMCHIIALLLIISDYTFSSTDILTDTRIKIARLQDLSRNLGCKIGKSRGDPTLVISLSVPMKRVVTLPYNPSGKSRGRKQ